MFPGAIFAIFFVLNLIIWGEKSSGAVPFGTLFALLCMWFGISVPLTFVGSYFGQSDPNYKERSPNSRSASRNAKAQQHACNSRVRQQLCLLGREVAHCAIPIFLTVARPIPLYSASLAWPALLWHTISGPCAARA